MNTVNDSEYDFSEMILLSRDLVPDQSGSYFEFRFLCGCGEIIMFRRSVNAKPINQIVTCENCYSYDRKFF